MSVYWELLTGVKTSLASVPMVPTVVIRDNFQVLDGEKMPLVVVTPGPTNETIRLQTFGKNIVYDYEVLVGYITKGNRVLEADMESYLNVREAIRNQLNQVGVPGLQKAWDTKIEVEEVNKFAALVGTNYKITAWRMFYSVAEVRAGQPTTEGS